MRLQGRLGSQVSSRPCVLPTPVLNQLALHINVPALPYPVDWSLGLAAERLESTPGLIVSMGAAGTSEDVAGSDVILPNSKVCCAVAFRLCFVLSA